MASIDRTAYPRFKRVVSARELAEAFTPTADEVEWARSKTATEQHFLALVVLLKCYQRLGYFFEAGRRAARGGRPCARQARAGRGRGGGA